MTRILLVDNYDSFVYNIAQYLGELGASVVVKRNDSPGIEEYLGNMDGYVISPGPGHPKSTNRSLDVISADGFGRPVLGVCLGHQAIAHVHGASIIRAERVVHGKVGRIRHFEDPIFKDVPETFSATRYHSLIIEAGSLPSGLEVSAWTESGLVMGIRHRELAVEGVQYHPESIMTAVGKSLLRNFLEGRR